jgi:hypothetical protein
MPLADKPERQRRPTEGTQRSSSGSNNELSNLLGNLQEFQPQQRSSGSDRPPSQGPSEMRPDRQPHPYDLSNLLPPEARSSDAMRATPTGHPDMSAQPAARDGAIRRRHVVDGATLKESYGSNPRSAADLQRARDDTKRLRRNRDIQIQSKERATEFDERKRQESQQTEASRQQWGDLMNNMASRERAADARQRYQRAGAEHQLRAGVEPLPGYERDRSGVTAEDLRRFQAETGTVDQMDYLSRSRTIRIDAGPVYDPPVNQPGSGDLPRNESTRLAQDLTTQIGYYGSPSAWGGETSPRGSRDVPPESPAGGSSAVESRSMRPSPPRIDTGQPARQYQPSEVSPLTPSRDSSRRSSRFMSGLLRETQDQEPVRDVNRLARDNSNVRHTLDALEGNTIQRGSNFNRAYELRRGLERERRNRALLEEDARDTFRALGDEDRNSGD